MMREEITRDIDVRPSSVALWFGALGGPVAWLVDLQIRYAIVAYACQHHAGWIMWLVTLGRTRDDRSAATMLRYEPEIALPGSVPARSAQLSVIRANRRAGGISQVVFCMSTAMVVPAIPPNKTATTT